MWSRVEQGCTITPLKPKLSIWYFQKCWHPHPFSSSSQDNFFPYSTLISCTGFFTWWTVKHQHPAVWERKYGRISKVRCTDITSSSGECNQPRGMLIQMLMLKKAKCVTSYTGIHKLLNLLENWIKNAPSYNYCIFLFGFQIYILFILRNRHAILGKLVLPFQQERC